MPESVEVRISKELIKPLLVGKYISRVSIGERSRYKNNLPEGYSDFCNSFIDPAKSPAYTNIISPCIITDVNVKGKFMYWTFNSNNNDWYMFSTFGMSGQWSPNPGKHVCFYFRLHSVNTFPCSYIYFNDPRHFGTIKFVNDKKILLDKLNSLGWDFLNEPLVNDESLTFIQDKLSNSSKTIGQLLLDQSVFAGVGNYIRAEALYEAKISPWRISKDLSKNDIENICQALVNVMKGSYAHQGATLHTYKDAYGNEGKYSSCFKVYSKKVDPLGNLIKKEKSREGRTIHWCPAIQY